MTYDPTDKQKGQAKLSRIPIKIEPSENRLPKPDWIRIRASTSDTVAELKKLLRAHKLHTVCEEASCPNLNECFSHGTATFMIMGDKCTRRCTFCDVAHGRPDALNKNEPQDLANVIQAMALRYVVITSVDRDDLRDGGAEHFADCIREIRSRMPNIKIEILVPDFRGRMEIALDKLSMAPPMFSTITLRLSLGYIKQSVRARITKVLCSSLNLLKHVSRIFPLNLV